MIGLKIHDQHPGVWYVPNIDNINGHKPGYLIYGQPEVNDRIIATTTHTTGSGRPIVLKPMPEWVFKFKSGSLYIFEDPVERKEYAVVEYDVEQQSLQDWAVEQINKGHLPVIPWNNKPRHDWIQLSRIEGTTDWIYVSPNRQFFKVPDDFILHPIPKDKADAKELDKYYVDLQKEHEWRTNKRTQWYPAQTQLELNEIRLKELESRPLWVEEDLVPPINRYPLYYLKRIKM